MRDAQWACLCRHNPRVVAAAADLPLQSEMGRTGPCSHAPRALAMEDVSEPLFAFLHEAAGPEVAVERLSGLAGGVLFVGPRGGLMDLATRLSRRQLAAEFSPALETQATAAGTAMLAALQAYERGEFVLRLPACGCRPAGELRLGGLTRVMGVINVTPDSFSDGGECFDVERAVARGCEMAQGGADLLDIGGESTRPGAESVPAAEQLRRVLPVISALARAEACRGVPLSVDTSSAEVAEKALDAGAQVVNDVTALRGDPRMAALVAERGVPVVLMHMQGTPRTMQDDPKYEHLLAEVCRFLRERMTAAMAAGVQEEQIVVDPGIGFGKTVAHNLELLRRLAELRSLGRPILVGTSRKSFIGRTLGLPVKERLLGTAATLALAVAAGAAVVRVHDVPEAVQVVRMADAVLGRT